MKTLIALMLCSFLTILTLHAQPQTLDSITVRTFAPDTQLWTNTDKEEHTFDERGNMTLFVDYDWNEGTQELLPNIKEEYTHDNQDRRTSYATYAWNDSTSAWTPNFREEHTYDEWDETLYRSSNWNDSIQQWIYEKKTERAHDTNGNRTLLARYNWDVDTEQWIGINIKREDTYDENNNLITAIKYGWDVDAGQWIGDEKEEYTYESDSLLTLDFTYNWNVDTQQWMTYSKSEYSHDNGGRETLRIEYRWSNSNQEWNNYAKNEYQYTNSSVIRSRFSWSYEYNDWELTGRRDQFYDAEGHLINETHYDCWGTPCLPLYRSVWAYDAGGNLLSWLSQEGGLGGSWLTNERETFTYDSNGNRLSATYEHIYWDSYSRWEAEYDMNNNQTEYRSYGREYEFGNWIPEYRRQWTYNTENQITSSIYSNWNTSTQEWQYAWKSEYEYDNTNYHILTIRSNWNEDTQAWEHAWKSTRTYDDAYTYADLILPPFDEYAENYFHGKRTNYTRYNWENGEWVYAYESTYHYSAITVSITYTNTNSDGVLIYPNPTHSILNIKVLNSQQINGVSLFDLAGRQVPYRIISNNTLNVSTLPSGMYWAKIEIDEAIFYKKIMVK